MVNKNIFILSLMLTSIYASDAPEKSSTPASAAACAAATARPYLEKAHAECSICQEKIDKTTLKMRGECDHWFHEKCIGPWLKHQLLEKTISGEDQINISTCPNCRGTFWKTPNINEYSLLAAAKSGNIATLRSTLASASSINLNATDKNRNTALILACKFGHIEIVRELIDKPGVDINAQNQYFGTPLILACDNGHTGIVELLLTKPSLNLKLTDIGNATAFITACYRGHSEIVKLLLPNPDVDINATTHGDNNSSLFWACHEGHTEVVKALLARSDLDLHVKISDGRTALDIAKKQKHEDIVALLEAEIEKRS